MPLNVQKVKWDQVGQARGTGLSVPSSSRLRPVSRRGGAADELFVEWILGPAAAVPKVSTRKGMQGVLFDLDGVLVDTAEFHYRAWQRLADELGVVFDRQMNHGFRGVARMECLEMLLGVYSRHFVVEEKLLLAERKNGYYLEQVMKIGPLDVAEGVRELVLELKGMSEGGVRVAVVSASRNAKLVLERLGILDWFDAVVDGGDVKRGKPDPQGFLLAAERLRVRPEACVVVEDADAGIRAGRAAGMKTVGVSVEGDLSVAVVGEVGAGVLEEMWRSVGLSV